jgi:hypothetical protein
MNDLKIIKVVTEYHPRPKWRYISEGAGSGEEFRQTKLAPDLKTFEHVEVDLTGYNRYGPSFISEAFGGLIRDEGFRLADLRHKLTITHRDLPSIVGASWAEIEKASKSLNK